MDRFGLTGRDVVALLTLIGGGVAFAAVERRQRLSAADGFWWAVTTATTVGYGDITPRTAAGRLVAGALMLERSLSGRRDAAQESEELRARLDEIVRRLDALEPRRP